MTGKGHHASCPVSTLLPFTSELQGVVPCDELPQPGATYTFNACSMYMRVLKLLVAT